MTPRERDFIAGLCAARAGLSIATEHSYLLESRLAPVARREGYGSVVELVRAIRDRGEERLVWAAVEAMAPAQTGFFRDPQVFEAVAERLQAEVGRGGSPAVWSAACATGQEIYSLAMLLAERGVERVELFASDLSGRMVERAQAGRYSHYEVQQGLSARRLVRHFENAEDAFALSADLCRRVRWGRLNLLDAPAATEAYDVILCRNVLGTLIPQARERVLARLTGSLRCGGWLVLGAGEAALAAGDLAPATDAPGVFARIPGIRAAA